MQTLVLEFENEKDLRDTAKKLWEGLKVTGEMGVKPLANGRWRLEVNSEKELREATLEKFKDYRVEI